MQDLFIDIEEIKAHAIRVNGCNEEYIEYLDSFSGEIEALIQNWESPSAHSLYEEFRKMIPLFGKYYDYIATYREFLEQTALTYEAVDRGIENSIDVN